MDSNSFFGGSISKNGYFNIYDSLGGQKFILCGGVQSMRERALSRLKNSELIYSPHTGMPEAAVTDKYAVLDSFGYDPSAVIISYFEAAQINDIAKTESELISCGMHKSRAAKILSAADHLLSDNLAAASVFTNYKKLYIVTTRICEREIKIRRKPGHESKRLLTGLSAHGYISANNLSAYQKIYIIKDDFGAASTAVIACVRNYLSAAGYDYIICPCPLTGKYEHLLVPELNLAFVSYRKKFMELSLTPYRVVNYSRFTDMEQLKKIKKRLNFNRKTVFELINEAAHEASKITAPDFDCDIDSLAEIRITGALLKMLEAAR